MAKAADRGVATFELEEGLKNRKRAALTWPPATACGNLAFTVPKTYNLFSRSFVSQMGF